MAVELMEETDIPSRPAASPGASVSGLSAPSPALEVDVPAHEERDEHVVVFEHPPLGTSTVRGGEPLGC